jgi:hypothetical protein
MSQDLNIYGKFSSYTADIDNQEVDAVYGSCFRGMNLVTCSPVLAEDDFSLAYDLDYYKSLAGVTGQFYCLKCCGTAPDHVDTWDMQCSVSDAINNGVNLFGYELRLARKAHSGDRGVIRCPLRRSACTYDSDGNTLECRPFETFTYLVGYTVKLWVNQYNQNFKYWKGVTKCEIETMESNFSLVTPEMFRETLVMVHEPLDSAQWDNFKVLIVLTFVIFMVYGILYFSRKARCMYCQQKLVFCTKLCYKCRIVGAEIPDPDLIKALEEKGQKIQGELPDDLLSPKTIIETFRDKVMGVFCCGFYYLCYCCCFYGAKNRARTFTRAVSQTIKVKPASSLPPRAEEYTKPGTAHTVILDEERGLNGLIELKQTTKHRSSSSSMVSSSMSRTNSNAKKPMSPSNSIVSNFLDKQPSLSKDPNSEAKSRDATLVTMSKSLAPSLPLISSLFTNNTAVNIDPVVAKKRQWWEKLFRKKINPNLLPFDEQIIQVAVRHPKEADTAEAVIQHVRAKKTEDKLLYESVYHAFDPRAVLHRSIVNTHEGDVPVQAAATLGRGA